MNLRGGIDKKVDALEEGFSGGDSGDVGGEGLESGGGGAEFLEGEVLREAGGADDCDVGFELWAAEF